MASCRARKAPVFSQDMTAEADPGDQRAGHAEQITRTAVIGTKNCEMDIETFCSNVTIGEGRILACLQFYADQVSPVCSQSLGNLRRLSLEPDFQATWSYPTLENRELGEAHADEDGDPIIWGRPLPFLAQKVVDLGFDLPNPFGVAVIPVWICQDLVLEDLFIGINGEPDTEIDFVDFGTPEVENTALKLDAWILPFLNVFTTVGVFGGEARIPLTIEGADLFPNLCSAAPNRPQCNRTYSAIADLGYRGKNITLGINLAMGWDRFFVTIPITHAWSDVDIIDNTVTALNTTPRIGMTGDMGNRGTVAVFIGATHLKAEVDVPGTIAFDTPGGPSGDVTTLAYRINQRNKDRWNYLLGFNWDLSKKWSVTTEAGFGGSRENFIAGATYRF